MHLIRGMSSLNTKKNTRTSKSKRLAAANEKHEAWIKSMGVSGKKSNYRHDIPNYKKDASSISTSDVICSNGTKKDSLSYTGNEIAGIATMHKSNAVPIRKDNKQGAIDIANMSR
jgi:hypothetical protein